MNRGSDRDVRAALAEHNARLERHLAVCADRAMAFSLATSGRGVMRIGLALIRQGELVVANARWHELNLRRREPAQWREIDLEGNISAPRAIAVEDIAREMLATRIAATPSIAPRVFEEEGACRAIEIRIEMMDLGSSAGDLVFVADVTERVQMERKLRETLAERERLQALAQLGELAAMAAHEVRNPVAVINNVASLLERSGPCGESNDALLVMLREETRRLDDVVAQLLAFGKPREPMCSSTSVAKLVESAVEGARAGRRERKVDVKVEIEAPFVEVAVDFEMVRQALVNLILNAIDASRDDAFVRVHVGSACSDASIYARIDVIDRGSGMTAELRSRLFTPFVSTKAVGTGLGLAIVERIIRAHGGEVRVTSREGEGSTFTVTLPCSREREVGTTADSSPPPTA